MIKAINYNDMPTDFPKKKVVFMAQDHYPYSRIIDFYTYAAKRECNGVYCVAVFTIKPKKP